LNRSVVALIKKDLLLEMRQQYTLYGILLYVASTIFVVYITLGQPEADVWNALFWVVQLFVCVNAVAKSFLQENKGRMLYFYSIAGAKDFIAAKLVFNALLMFVITLLALAVFTVLLGSPENNFAQFAGIAFLGGLGLSLVFTFLAAIAAKAQQQAALMAVIGFPVIVPQLMLLGKIAKASFASVPVAEFWKLFGLLIGFDCMVVVLALILFPFLWKE
jgi:heme exporter protein B